MLHLRSLRAKFLLGAIAGVLLPLAVVGLWLARATEHSGEMLLRERLRAGLASIVDESGASWVRTRSALLDIADDPAVQAALEKRGRTTNDATRSVSAVAAAAQPAFTFGGDLRPGITLRTPDGVTRWSISGVGDSVARLEAIDRSPAPDAGRITVAIPVYARATGASIGSMQVTLPPDALIPPSPTRTGVIGAVLGIVDAANGASLAPLPFDPTLLSSDEFSLGGEHWVVERRAIQEPRVDLVAAAPLTAYTAPFQAAAQRGAIALLVVAMATLAFVTLLTRHLTRSLERLAGAADAVSRGDLGRQVSVLSTDEVGRVAAAFNTMTENLRRTLAELARRESLAAVGDFAASLAHEVRNPLTSIRINLQRVEEKISTTSELRTPLERALREIARLERTVTGSLSVARSGNVTRQHLDLRTPIERAMQAAEPAFNQADATLEPLSAEDGAGELGLSGDPAALEQVFLNLLLNAAQALEPGGRAGVTAASSADRIEVTVWDNGPGIAPDSMDHVFDPFFTTKAEGTGLGLAIARQIVVAHGGEISVERNGAKGTSMRVRLPRGAQIDSSMPT
jgi:signal transduction histidine kinase